jgi:hypothetical protein
MDLWPTNLRIIYDFECMTLIEAKAYGLETVKIQASRSKPLAQLPDQPLGKRLLDKP